MKILFTSFIFCCLVNQVLPAQEIIFFEDFESNAHQNAWTITPGKEYGIIEVVQTDSSGNNHAVRLGKSTDGDEKLTMNRLDLALNLSVYSRVMLDFDIYHYYDATHPQDGIYLSVDGGHFFTKVYSFDFDNWVPKVTGTIPTLDLTLLAKAKNLTLSNRTVIRFQQYGSNDFNGSERYSDGLQLDNVRILSPSYTYSSLPFKEDFEGDTWSSAISVGNTISTNSERAPSPFGVVEIIPFNEQQGQVLRLGSRYDKHFATNALDLHANLTSQTEIELSFKLLNNLDETHPQDGIFFSPDGGEHFTKVFDFDLEEWRNKKFGAYPPINVNQLARQYNIPLTSQFVIRFQQYDDSDFEGSRLSSDGIYLDDIVLQEVSIVYAPYPFREDFEADLLAPYWKHGMPDGQHAKTVISPTGRIELVTDSGNRSILLGNTVDRLYTTNALDLYIDLSKAKSPELGFKILSHYDETHPQDGVYFSQNAGKNFVKVLDFDGSRWADKAWGNFYSLDIRELAAQHQLHLTDQFVIRFQQHDDDDFEGTRTVSDGIYLDDITIQEPQCYYYTTLPFVETFESDSLAKYWRVGSLSRTLDEQMILPGSSAVIIDTLSYSHSRALALGRISDGQLTAGAIDLHLNLSYQSNLELNFWMYSHVAESQSQNGIWISNNGGKNFKLVYQFNPTVQQQYTYHTLNLDSLVNAAALDYTDQFIIRFQQRGDRSFLGQGSFASGAIIDDVVVTNRLDAPNVQDVRLNYKDHTNEQQIQWQSVKSATTYQIQLFVEEISSRHMIEERSSSVNSVSISPKTLSPGRLYYFRVRSTNDNSKSAWSRPVAFSADDQGRINAISYNTPNQVSFSGE